MAINHVLLELWCLKDIDEHAHKPLPSFCTAVEDPNYPDEHEPNFNCLRCKCPFVDFTTCEHTLCYINEKSEMEHGILFGGDMGDEHDSAEIERWKKMSVDAVEQTYEKYMKEAKTV